jgi:phage tail-like protein
VYVPDANPYRGSRFRVIWDGAPVTDVMRVSALRRTTAVVEYRDASAPQSSRKQPGPTSFEPVTIERAAGADATFETWANLVAAGGSGASILKDVRIEIVGATGSVMLAYVLHRCWPSAYQVLPTLETGGHGSLTESLTLQHDGWTRDTSVVPPM